MEYCEFQTATRGLSEEKKDMLTAILSDFGFESFYEENGLYKAYIQQNSFTETAFQTTMSDAERFLGKLQFSIAEIPSTNWNQTWENTFDSIRISDEILIKTSTSNNTDTAKHTIVINPRMAFGSGTHETTSLILQAMKDIDFDGKTVADCGCGTGILAIFASMLGAKNIIAFDYDKCSVDNSIENIELNNIHNISVFHSSFEIMENKKFDIILANITRNILVENIKRLIKSLNPDGILIASGFYSDDIEIIRKNAESTGLTFVGSQTKNNWSITTFIHK